jgi:hypothetical protein
VPEETKSKRGGARTGAGRKKLKPEVAEGDKLFATRVLARIGKPGWEHYADLKKVKNDEDFALYLLLTHHCGYDQFHKLLDRKYGKPVQRVRVGNPEGEKLKLEVDVTSVRNKLISMLAS